MRILVVEDERRLADTLCDLLTKNKYIVDAAYDGESGLDMALSDIYDTIILDVMLPGKDGFEIVRNLREAGVGTPVLLLTARTEIHDKVKGLDCGADYYLTKPFDSMELLATVRSLLRRQGEIVSEILEYGDLQLNISTCTLSCGDESIRLSSKEFELIKILMQNREHIVSKDSLLVKIWGYDSEAEDNHVEVYISFLRKKLGFLKSSVKIDTVRRVGYHLGVNTDD